MEPVIYPLAASASSSRAIAAWWAARWCGASRSSIAKSLPLRTKRSICAARPRPKPGSPRSRHGLRRCGDRRRHPRQRHAARRIPLRQHDDRGECHRGRPAHRRPEAALPRLVLHLSASRAAADERRASADRRARADQPMVCDRQDRRLEALRRVSPGIWQRLHLSPADQSLRTGRYF